MNTNTSLDNPVFVGSHVMDYYWIFFMESNPKRLLMVLLLSLSLLQGLELLKSFTTSVWTKKLTEKAVTSIRLRLTAGVSSSIISLILTSCIWFQYRLFHIYKPPGMVNNGLFRLELFTDFTVALLTLLAQFLTIELHSSLLSQSKSRRASLYAHYLMVILINIFSAAIVFNCMMNFHTNALLLLNTS